MDFEEAICIDQLNCRIGKAFSLCWVSRTTTFSLFHLKILEGSNYANIFLGHSANCIQPSPILVGMYKCPGRENKEKKNRCVPSPGGTIIGEVFLAFRNEEC
jgi:hypothetical protein